LENVVQQAFALLLWGNRSLNIGFLIGHKTNKGGAFRMTTDAISGSTNLVLIFPASLSFWTKWKIYLGKGSTAGFCFIVMG